MNGRSTGRVAEFIARDDAQYASPSDLRRLGLVLPPAQGEDLIAISTIPALLFQIDEAGQRLIVTAGDAAVGGSLPLSVLDGGVK